MRRTTGRGMAVAIGIAVAAAASATGVAHAAHPARGTAVGHAAADTAWDPHHIDFNGDGHPDVAVGAPGATVDGATGAGYVSVVYGGAHGIDSATHATISQDTAHVPGAAATGNGFGTTVVPVDLNGDGYTDLVVGAPGEEAHATVYAGTLTVLWGGPKGLTRGKVVDTGLPSYRFEVGSMLAAGDFDGDGVTDLVVIVTDQDEEDSWRGVLFLGGPNGMTRVGVLKDAKGNFLSGQHAAIGDLNGDGYGDIVMGHGQDGYDSDEGLPTKGGALGVAYGGPKGLSSTIAPVWINQDTQGVPGVGERSDGMGSSVAVADVNGDGYADVVTGVPNEEFSGIVGAGSFLYLKGGPHGLTGTGARVFSQNTAGMPGTAEKDDHFGQAVAVIAAAAGQTAQVVVGDPDENDGNGAIWAMGTTSAGPEVTGTSSFGPGTLGSPAEKAAFGSALTGH